MAAVVLGMPGLSLQLLPRGSITTGLFEESSRSWVNGWTVFFWAWWIAWSPFVGLFIARISKGRTIQEYVLGVLLAPTLIAVVWLTAFGGTTLRQQTEHQVHPKTSLPTFPVAVVDKTGALQKDASGRYIAELRSLTVVRLSLCEHHRRRQDIDCGFVAHGVVRADGRSVSFEGDHHNRNWDCAHLHRPILRHIL